ncbi:hypothetical protein [Rhodoferax sp. GW822-FHT02A01]|uniref:hypothetical protein n=1 Tax=Rhodoferax sp. GW822-FHT02A01 TaxID=3141537 RepID=UPI00315CFCC5
MRSIILSLAALVALPATAEAPEMQYHYGCSGDKLIIQMAVSKKGVFQIVLPAAVCGPQV